MDLYNMPNSSLPNNDLPTRKDYIKVAIILFVIIATIIVVFVTISGESTREYDAKIKSIASIYDITDFKVKEKKKVGVYLVGEVFDSVAYEDFLKLHKHLKEEFIDIEHYETKENVYKCHLDAGTVTKNGSTVYKNEEYKEKKRDDYEVGSNPLAGSLLDNNDSNYKTLSYSDVTDKDDKSDAWVMAQYYVKQNLKNPKSADFPSYGGSDIYIKYSGKYFRVTSYVYAENSFGAEKKVSFVVYMKKSGNNFSLLDCSIIE